MFEDEIRDPMTGKSRRLSLSLQKRPREHDSDSVKVKKPWKALQASRLATMIGTASHCVINVNLVGPSINTERQKEELEYEDKSL